MKALILNSGTGSRLGELTKTHPKCMTELTRGETIISRQLRMLQPYAFHEIVITTGPLADTLESYCQLLDPGCPIRFVHNPDYRTTNYIRSMHLAGAFLDDDLLLLHGDLVFDADVLHMLLRAPDSHVVTSDTQPLPEKDFKAVLQDGYVKKIGVEFFDNAVFMQPMYHLERTVWQRWLTEITAFCKRGETGCYAENAFNCISDDCKIRPLNIENRLCAEIDTPEDLKTIQRRLA